MAAAEAATFGKPFDCGLVLEFGGNLRHKYTVSMSSSASQRRRWWRILVWCCAVILLGFAALIAFLWVLLDRVPQSYPPVAHPIEIARGAASDNELEGFGSPYLGHTGSWDGKGGGMFGASKIPDLDTEQAMHLHWTFMAAYWRALEPGGPADLARETPAAWKEMDAFLVAAHQRRLNILMQAPVLGGNAGGPPTWAGRREQGKSAPANMEAAAAFAGKLAARYAPGGTLARQQGWGANYGVRAWELDNEPDGYLTHWKNQAADYAEFVTKTAAAIRQADPRAVILGPATMGSGKACRWIEGALDAGALNGSPACRSQGAPYSIGPVLDAISFHVYEGLDSALSGKERTVEIAFSEIRDLFERYEDRSAGFHYARKQQYWHTEGNFDFFGVLSRERRAAWRMQFFTRAFAAGISKVAVMDASKPEQAAVRAYVDALPDPFPMRRAGDRVKVLSGSPAVFLHLDDTNAEAGRVWVLWATGASGAEVDVPTIRERVMQVSADASHIPLKSANHAVRVRLKGDAKMAPPILLLDRARAHGG
jgi:hypothetical protein